MDKFYITVHIAAEMCISICTMCIIFRKFMSDMFSTPCTA